MEMASFAEANLVLDKPKDMTYDECSVASVLRTQTDDGLPLIISCWKPSVEELKSIQETGRIWLTVVGQTMPPLDLSAHKPF